MSLYQANNSNNPSWFQNAPHRWATASLPLAYAVACVEVVAKKSEKAKSVYQQLIDTWINPGLKNIYETIISEVPESDIKKVKKALLHPESEFLPDPNKPFKQIEEVFADLEQNGDLIFDNILKIISDEVREDIDKLTDFVKLIIEFIVFGFNRKSDIEKGRYRVIPSDKHPWLIWAVVMKTSFESHNINLERLRKIYKVKKYKGKIIDFEKILTEEPMSRWHRRIVSRGKAAGLKLKNDRVIIEAARHWYNSRVVFSSINKYCDAPGHYYLDPKNISRQISPCDDAVGYIRRLQRKTT